MVVAFAKHIGIVVLIGLIAAVMPGLAFAQGIESVFNEAPIQYNQSVSSVGEPVSSRFRFAFRIQEEILDGDIIRFEFADYGPTGLSPEDFDLTNLDVTDIQPIPPVIWYPQIEPGSFVTDANGLWFEYEAGNDVPINGQILLDVNPGSITNPQVLSDVLSVGVLNEAHQMTVRVTRAGNTIMSLPTVMPIVDDSTISVSATVLPTLTFELHDTSDTSFGVLNPALLDFGDLSTTTTQSVAHGFRIGTNAANGYVVTASGDTLTHDNGMDTIDAIGSTLTASATGSEQFGLCVVIDATASDMTQPGAISADYQCGTSVYAWDDTASNAVAFGNGGSSTIASGQPTSMTYYDVEYIANIGSLTEAGSYSTEVTYLATGMF